MKRILPFLVISLFAIFVGSQITEGFLLVPYWKTLSSSAFYEHYASFGPTIGRFYTVLTLMALLITILVSIYAVFKDSLALKYALLSTVFLLLCIALFFFYFKETNQGFYEAAFSANALQEVLRTWEFWHWLRVFFECTALIFLSLGLARLNQGNVDADAISTKL